MPPYRMKCTFSKENMQTRLLLGTISSCFRAATFLNTPRGRPRAKPLRPSSNLRVRCTNEAMPDFGEYVQSDPLRSYVMSHFQYEDPSTALPGSAMPPLSVTAASCSTLALTSTTLSAAIEVSARPQRQGRRWPPSPRSCLRVRTSDDDGTNAAASCSVLRPSNAIDKEAIIADGAIT